MVAKHKSCTKFSLDFPVGYVSFKRARYCTIISAAKKPEAMLNEKVKNPESREIPTERMLARIR